jgi:hypothetical protein
MSLYTIKKKKSVLHTYKEYFNIFFTNLLTFFITNSQEVTFHVNRLLIFLMFSPFRCVQKTFFFFYFRGMMPVGGSR